MDDRGVCLSKPSRICISLIPRPLEKRTGNFRKFKLYTDVKSRQLQYFIIILQQTSARDTYNFSSCENGAFLQLFAVRSTTEVKWKSFERGSSCKAPALARSSKLLKWNGRDCNSSMHYAIGFYCCHVTAFWNLIGTANFQAAEVTVWTRGSSQAVCPTAWEQELDMYRIQRCHHVT